MALTATVTKKSVKYVQPKLHAIVFSLSLKDNDVEVLNQDVSVEYRSGEAPSGKVAEVKEKMQILIDNYKSEVAIFNAAALDTAVTNIAGGLIL
jgi:hypothetical protein